MARRKLAPESRRRLSPTSWMPRKNNPSPRMSELRPCMRKDDPALLGEQGFLHLTELLALCVGDVRTARFRALERCDDDVRDVHRGNSYLAATPEKSFS